MTDLLIRNVPDDEISAIDTAADRLGLSRAEFLRREMRRIARYRTAPPATPADYQLSRAAMADLGDARVMRDAWS
ncbi:MAG: hypothetical protein BGO26_10025 [Actinobacteria bacterium 69-20]|jgi:hypothetical protein|nr:antitoxin [Actinomycetota bacterium]OJV23238.1 MAG: hypothetical protein BGO26_10025 [Actinobacteria bacterium 69-20]